MVGNQRSGTNSYRKEEEGVGVGVGENMGNFRSLMACHHSVKSGETEFNQNKMVVMAAAAVNAARTAEAPTSLHI